MFPCHPTPFFKTARSLPETCNSICARWTYTIEPVPVLFESLYMPKSQRTLSAAIDLARACDAEIGTVSNPVSAGYCRTD
jgi:hypothetical protein